MRKFIFNCTKCEKKFEIEEGNLISCPRCDTVYDLYNNRIHNDFHIGDTVEVWSEYQNKMVEAIFTDKSAVHKQFSNVFIPSEKRYARNRIAHPLPEVRITQSLLKPYEQKEQDV